MDTKPSVFWLIRQKVTWILHKHVLWKLWRVVGGSGGGNEVVICIKRWWLMAGREIGACCRNYGGIEVVWDRIASPAVWQLTDGCYTHPNLPSEHDQTYLCWHNPLVLLKISSTHAYVSTISFSSLSQTHSLPPPFSSSLSLSLYKNTRCKTEGDEMGI